MIGGNLSGLSERARERKMTARALLRASCGRMSLSMYIRSLLSLSSCSRGT